MSDSPDHVTLTVMGLEGNQDMALPSYETAGSSGLDLRAAVHGELTLHPGDIRLIPTGLAISLPPGYEAQVRPRSGLALKHGVGMVNSPGTVDSDYRGEIGLVLINWGKAPLCDQEGRSHCPDGRYPCFPCRDPGGGSAVLQQSVNI